ncbi:MAG: MarR family transcriptional regulator [Dehalococcoidia bacterium]
MSQQSHDFTAWAEFRHRVKKILGREARFAREAGLSPRQHEVLVMLCGARHDPAPTPAELAERASLPRATVTRVVNTLERRGLVRRRPAPRTGADPAVTPTAQACRLIESAAQRQETALLEDGRPLLDSLSALVPSPRARTRGGDAEHHQPVAPHRGRRRTATS